MGRPKTSDLLTVAEFSKVVNRSQQSIYKRIERGSLNDYIFVINGRKLIHRNAAFTVFGVPKEEPEEAIGQVESKVERSVQYAAPDETVEVEGESIDEEPEGEPVEAPEAAALDAAILRTYIDQLKAKDRQIERLQQANEDLSEALKMEQMLRAAEQKKSEMLLNRVLALTDKSGHQDAQAPDPEHQGEDPKAVTPDKDPVSAPDVSPEGFHGTGEKEGNPEENRSDVVTDRDPGQADRPKRSFLGRLMELLGL